MERRCLDQLALDKEHGAILVSLPLDETTSALAVRVKHHENPALTAGISWCMMPA
jgi:hypothetical protein